ncbi:exonuclease [Escherichia phage vB_EcoP_PAS7]|uniref:Exonuclease n=1 Tax=Escherichia phage vB_EcoP_PAS7 TaxID=3053875 RepID=A0AA51Z383_9CAUD|nr:exonuclease [Escherichia phage vB_EcoP_PAS7]
MMIGGVNLDTLAVQLETPPVSDKVLLLDADQHIYKAASTVKRLDTAIRRFYQSVLEEKFYVNTKEVRAYITPSNNFKCGRFLLPTVKPYQQQRSTREELPLKAPLKEHLIANPHEYAAQGIEIVFDYLAEADDRIIEDSIEFGERGVVSSFDKDMNLCRGPKWNPELGTIDTIDNEYGWIDYNKDKGKIVGHGTAFFWAQMLMGDTADNVKGIQTLNGKSCGPAKAYEFLKDFTDSTNSARAVVLAYAEINQNFLAEAECLWLHRNKDDSAFKYIHPLLDDELQKWCESLHSYNEDYKAWRLSTQQ